MQFWPPDDEHMCSKHVEARNKLIVKQKFYASSWLITEINILRCTVSKTSKKITDHLFYICQIFEKKWEYNEAVHQLFLDVKKAYHSVLEG